jgi:GH18 family chitinase
MVSYDTPEIVNRKLEYIKANGLGGSMWWETSGDRPKCSNDSLICVAARGLGGPQAEDLEKRYAWRVMRLTVVWVWTDEAPNVANPVDKPQSCL